MYTKNQDYTFSIDTKLEHLWVITANSKSYKDENDHH